MTVPCEVQGAGLTIGSNAVGCSLLHTDSAGAVTAWGALSVGELGIPCCQEVLQLGD